MALKIKISGRGAALVSYRDLLNFQGDLKILSEESYQRIRASILKFGFMEPISVWLDDDRLKMLNGHQRLSAVKRMIDNENYEPVDLPINYIEALNYQDAKLRVLALTSEYGQMTQAGAVNFLADMNLTSVDLDQFAQLRQIDINSILSSIGETHVASRGPDEFDVGNMVAGLGNSPIAPVDPTVRNDPMTGLRLMQIFLTNDQLEDVKSKIDRIMTHYKVENTTEAILRSIDIAVAGIDAPKKEANENNKSKPAKKSKA